MIKKIPWVLLAVLLFLPFGAHAATFLADELVSPPDDLFSDLFAAGERVVVSHGVVGDVFVGAGTVEILDDALIEGDVVAVGETVTITGAVEDDIMAAGSEVTITDITIDDIFAAGSKVEISEDVQVLGSAYLGGETVTIAGGVAGDVYAAGSRIILTETASIDGDLRTFGETPTIAAGATITGEHVHKAAAEKKGTSTQDRLLAWVTSVVAWFVTAVLALYLLTNLMRHAVDSTFASPAANFGLGALWYLLLVPVIILLLISLIGLPTAFVLIGLAIALGILGFAGAALIIGAWLMRKVWKVPSTEFTWQHALLGVVVLRAVGIIPVVGWLLVLIVSVTATGGLLRGAWKLFKPETVEAS